MLVLMCANVMRPYQIRALASADAMDAARLHVAGQPNTFLTNLGEGALEIVYRALVNGDAGFGVVAATPAAECANGRVIGFAAASTSTLALYADVARQSGLTMAREVLKSTARHPALLLQAVESALYPLRQARKASEHADAELLAIMVDPVWRGSGVGGALLDALLRQSLAQKITTIEVTVDAANAGARRFYGAQGFTHHSDFRLNGRAMCGYLLAFAPAHATPTTHSVARLQPTL